jgi:hypothetical protein
MRGLTCKKVKVEAQVEQRSIRLGVFSTLNLDLDLSLDLPMGRTQWRLNQTDQTNQIDQIDQPRVSPVPLFPSASDSEPRT